MGKYLYMAVTADSFEEPIYIENSVVDLSSRLGVSPSTIYNSINLGRSGKISGRKIIKTKNL